MPKRRTLKLATFNVNGISTRLANLLNWLEEAKPDVVALQELKATDGAFPAQALEAAGYGAIWHGQQSWNGVALLGRQTQPIESRRGLPGDP
ncbi:endonuclease/exonuclease/phosphatase family protein, partial [Pseudoxanthomonas winnipegensis]|uniref:endonuclease/exonuclease/phosphatase family protein n=1 Tax=Pseudoxanthomonas winnipegensis TaxID=2480810 RepID=UPI0030F49027